MCSEGRFSKPMQKGRIPAFNLTLFFLFKDNSMFVLKKFFSSTGFSA
jgi:hypothetical protein